MRYGSPSDDRIRSPNFEPDDRLNWQNPNELLSHINLQPNWVIADVGCGRGFFTIPLAYRVQKVYGIDVKQEKLNDLKSNFEELQLTNIVPLLGDTKLIPIDNNIVDFLISVNTLHEFENKDHMINEMRRVLKPNGKALISDFDKRDTGFGPPILNRLSRNETTTLLENTGFKILQVHSLKYHYLIVLSN